VIDSSAGPRRTVAAMTRDNPHALHVPMQGRGFPQDPRPCGVCGAAWMRGRRSVRLAVRTLVFQAGNGGSIPPRTMPEDRGQRTDDRPVAQRWSGPLTTDRLGVRIPPGRLADGAQVLAAASPALTRVVRVQVPRALLAGWRTGVWCNGSMAVSKTARCGFESYRPCWLGVTHL
jgi:hypothetical protein